MSKIGYHWETEEKTEEVKKEVIESTFYERHKDAIDTIGLVAAYTAICYVISVPFIWICCKINKHFQ